MKESNLVVTPRRIAPQKYYRYWLILLFAMPLAVLSNVRNSTTLQIYDLRCEHLVNPLGIDAETPRFSWKLRDAAFIRGQRQTAYRILVATTPAQLKKGKADVWDSGIVLSEQSRLVDYGGKALKPGNGYYWKVQVYDGNGKPSGWSETARFSMGLLNRSDWKGKWIKHPSALPEKHIWFRKTLVLNEQAATAFAYIASAGYHELYVNGKKAGNSVLAPSVSRLDKRILYVTYDIAPLLKKGDNVIAIWYAAGWSRNNYFESLVNQALLVQAAGTTKKGDAFNICSDETWKCAESYSRYTGRFQFMDMGGEEIDGRKYLPDWNTVSFDDTSWANALSVNPLKTGGNLILSAQMTDPSRIIEALSAVQIADTIPGVWSVDMGKSFTGFIEARFDGLQQGDTVLIQISNRTETVEEHRQRQYYIARGENGETFANRFNFSGGRYVHFTGLKQKPKLSDIKAYAVSSAGTRTGYFECSEPVFNQMYETDQWTYEMCHTEGVIVDCPNRERLGYGPEGAYLTTWGLGLPCFASGAYYLKNLRDWSDVQAGNGKLNYVAPQISIMWGNALNGTAPMNIAWEHYNAYGDPKALEAAYETGRRWLNFLFQYLDDDGLLTPYDEEHGHFLGEWLRPGHLQELEINDHSLFFNNCVYAMALDHYIHIAEALGRNDETASYRKRLQILQTALHKKYYNPEKHSYLDGDQVRSATALFAGIVPEDLQPDVLKHLENDMTGAHPYFDIGSFSRYQYFHVLLAHPQFAEIIYNILSKTTYPGYGYFLAKGETAWPETWEIDEDKNSAKIHTGYTGISAWFIKSLAGIEPVAENPGYQTVSIRPRIIEKISFARAGVETPYGLVESGWEKDNGNIRFDIVIPADVKAHVYLPASRVEITESGNPLSQVKYIKIIKETPDYLLIEVLSGKYRFECKNIKH
ncbi:MAG: family 78 glycoside hydrolase catalytic domain [Dysgonamonadaceae bacterium]|jgi:alpha-L-rhamnosidase|nr:family 78 glycoside hydrolase catalytic domain [Dysgonamonadaceae bacterium]